MALKQHLLSTKIQLPPLPAQTIRRARLLEALDRGLQANVRVTLISAPAGYGKTTLLSAWAQARVQDQALTAAWFSISQGDNDPARFMAYLVAAFEAASDDLDLSPPAEGDGSEAAFQERLVPLINQIGRRPTQTILVLDDYHLIQNQTVHDLTAYLLENLPPQAHLYLATRADPALPLARLRGRGQVNELRMADLRFRLQEAEAFLSRLPDLRLMPDDVQTLHRRTEGWISGLQMAAASLRGRTDTTGLIQSFSGSHHYIMDYLLDEVLHRQPDEMQSFLLQTSILERLSADLCDAVTGSPGALPSPSRRMLHSLEQSNLFIVPLDDQREWYRYHRLFADLLQARPQQEAGDRVPTLHRRASDWYAAHGLIDDAVWHALSSGDAELAAGLVERYSQEILLRSETTTFLAWVQRLPEEQVQARPRLGIYRAWALLLQGAPLSVVEVQLGEERRATAPPGSAESLEAMILLSQGQVERGLALAEQALASLPSAEIYLRDMAAMCVASARMSLGDVEGGIRVLDEATRRTRRSGNRSAAVTFLCEVAEIRLKQLQLDTSEQLYQRAVDIGAEGDGVRLPISGRALIGLGDIALERYELESAERLLLEGIDLTRRWSLIGTLNGYLTLAMLYEATGRETLMLEALETLSDLAQQFDASEFDDMVVDMLRAAVAVRRGELDQAEEWILGRDLGHAPGRMPVRYEQDQLASRIYKYELPIVARWHMAREHYQQALEALRELTKLAEQADRPYLQIEAGVLQARVHGLLDDRDAALEALKRALDLARPARSRRVFLTEGDEMIRLLKAGRQVWEAPNTNAFVDDLLAKIEPDTGRAPAGSQPLVEPLSPRELEVLRLLPTGLNVTALADELSISVNTVRSHMKHIYAKLDVHSRHEAVARAVEEELL